MKVVDIQTPGYIHETWFLDAFLVHVACNGVRLDLMPQILNPCRGWRHIIWSVGKVG
jgi:hypothetical protein